ncbi:MAG: 50S ribosomal protein L18 [Candidatus Woesearchaeota archaeon]
MVSYKKKRISFRRKIKGKTNYRKRLNLLKSRIPRLVIRISNKRIVSQITNYSSQGDTVILNVTSSDLRKKGWNYSLSNIPAAYLTGLLIGKKALSKKIDNVIPDIGFRTPVKGSKIYAVIKGAVDAKLNVPCDSSIFPSQERLVGEHIKKYATINKNEKQFSRHKKQNIDINDISKSFEDIKKKILSE